jgi:hypothetical protein
MLFNFLLKYTYIVLILLLSLMFTLLLTILISILPLNPVMIIYYSKNSELIAFLILIIFIKNPLLYNPLRYNFQGLHLIAFLKKLIP